MQGAHGVAFYLRALVKETLRWRPAAPLGIAHTTTEDDLYEGILIHKGPFSSRTCSNATMIPRHTTTMRWTSIRTGSWVGPVGRFWVLGRPLRRAQRTDSGGGPVSLNTWPTKCCTSVWPWCSGLLGWNALETKVGRRSLSIWTRQSILE